MNAFETVAHTEEEYVAIAARLGNDRPWREMVASKIRARSHMLWERQDVIDSWAAFLRRSVRSVAVAALLAKDDPASVATLSQNLARARARAQMAMVMAMTGQTFRRHFWPQRQIYSRLPPVRFRRERLRKQRRHFELQLPSTHQTPLCTMILELR